MARHVERKKEDNDYYEAFLKNNPSPPYIRNRKSYAIWTKMMKLLLHKITYSSGVHVLLGACAL